MSPQKTIGYDGMLPGISAPDFFGVVATFLQCDKVEGAKRGQMLPGVSRSGGRNDSRASPAIAITAAAVAAVAARRPDQPQERPPTPEAWSIPLPAAEERRRARLGPIRSTRS